VSEMPEQKPQSEQPVASLSGGLLNYLVISITFLVVGVIIGVTISNNTSANDGGIDATVVERIMRDVLADAELGGGVDRFELVDDDPYIGAEDAPVVIVEFSDFRCPYCGRHYTATLEPLLENYGEHIRYVYRDFAALGPESVAAAVASQCAFEQGVFWEFHDTFFTSQDQLGRDFYIATAEENGIDVDEFTTCIDESRYLNEVNSDGIDGQLNGVSGTPGFFINGNFVRGAQPYEVFERLVLRELSKAGIDVEQATQS
jgi:protein-disulfide isomerase